MKKNSSLFTSRILLGLVAFLFALSAGVVAAEPIKMKIGLSNEPGSPRVRGAELFAKLITERTGGQVEVKIFPSSQLGATRAMFEQIQMGSLECTLTPTSYFGAFSKMITLLDLPFLFPDIKTYYKVMTGPFGDEISQETFKAKMAGPRFLDRRLETVHIQFSHKITERFQRSQGSRHALAGTDGTVSVLRRRPRSRSTSRSSTTHSNWEPSMPRRTCSTGSRK